MLHDYTFQIFVFLYIVHMYDALHTMQWTHTKLLFTHINMVFAFFRLRVQLLLARLEGIFRYRTVGVLAVVCMRLDLRWCKWCMVVQFGCCCYCCFRRRRCWFRLGYDNVRLIQLISWLCVFFSRKRYFTHIHTHTSWIPILNKSQQFNVSLHVLSMLNN